MGKLHVFVDGSWLFKACAPDRALANRMEYPDAHFRLDFGRLTSALLKHAQTHDPSCTEFGQRIFCTSIFSLPNELDQWPTTGEATPDEVANLKNNVMARERFSESAIRGGFSDTAIFRPKLKAWMLGRLRERRFQEKQVDTTVVALLVKEAITSPRDYHTIITGDADILPAIRVAYPEYSKNVFVATTHPDQLHAEARQSSFSLSDFSYGVTPFYLEQHVSEFAAGDHVYVCAHCSKTFARAKAIPKRATSLPCCNPCNQRRT